MVALVVNEENMVEYKGLVINNYREESGMPTRRTVTTTGMLFQKLCKL